MVSAITFSPTQAHILARMVLPLRSDAPIETVRYLASLKFSSDDVNRMNELSAMARAGTLSDADGKEMDEYEDIGLLMEQVKSEARGRLRELEAQAIKLGNG